jgi:hypothetical protein
MSSSPEDLGAVDLSRLADLLHLCRTAFLEISAAYRWEPAAGSRAATDRVQLVGVDPQASALHRMAGYDLIREQVASFLEIASLQLNSASALLKTDFPLLAVESLGRSALEAMAHAITLLHPEASARQRLARAYVLEAQSASFGEKVAPLRPASDNVSRRGDVASVLDRARAIFTEVDADTVKKDRIGGIYRFPGYTQLSAGFINLLRSHGGLAMDADLVDPIYRYLSSSTHPALFRVEDLRVYGQDGSTRLSHQPGQMVDGVRLVVALYVISLWSVCDYFGWDKTPTVAIWDLLDDLFPGTVTA